MSESLSFDSQSAQEENSETGLHFDPCQFSPSFHPRSIASVTHLAHSDVRAGMHAISGAGSRQKRWIPAWAFDEKKVRMVIAARLSANANAAQWWNTMEDWRKSNEIINFRIRRGPKFGKDCPRYQRRMFQAHKRTVLQSGGYAEFITQVFWRAYRLGHTSPQIAEALHCSPLTVRQQLLRLNRFARLLFPADCSRRHWTARKNRATAGAERRKAVA